jgi:hypothetical protein
VHDHDYPTADKAVGRSATERWGTIRARDVVKAQAREKGQTPALIRHNGPGFVEYEPMNAKGRDARRALTKAAIVASQASKQAK